jgi:hypothetical protein
MILAPKLRTNEKGMVYHTFIGNNNIFDIRNYIGKGRIQCWC